MFVCINYDFGSFFNEMCIQTRPLDFVVNQNFNISYKERYLFFFAGSLTGWETVLLECGENSCAVGRLPDPTQLAPKIINREESEEVIHIIV